MDLDVLHADFLSLQKLLEPEGSWIRLFQARRVVNSRGHSAPCKPTHEDAFCWCLGGGIEKVTGDSDNTGPRSAAMFQKLSDLILGMNYATDVGSAQGVVVEWNDEIERKHSEVRELIQKAVDDTKRAEEIST